MGWGERTPGPMTLGGRLAAAAPVLDLRDSNDWQRVGIDWCTTHGSFRLTLADARCHGWDHDDRCEDISGSAHEDDENCSPCDFRPLAYRKILD